MAEQQEWDKERAEQHARWAKMASRLSYAPFARKIVGSLAPLKSWSTIVDLGTGPGILSIELNKLLPQAKIIGVDLSSDMLEIARKNADEAGMSNYEMRLGRAEEIPVESNSVNLVVTQSSFVSSQKVGANPCGRLAGQAQGLPLPQVIEKIPSFHEWEDR